MILKSFSLRNIGYWSPCMGENAKKWATNSWPSFTLESHVNCWTYLWITFDFLWLKGQILCHEDPPRLRGGVSQVPWFTDKLCWPRRPLRRWCTASLRCAPVVPIRTRRLLTSSPRPWRPWWCRTPSDTPLNLTDTTTVRQPTARASSPDHRSVNKTHNQLGHTPNRPGWHDCNHPNTITVEIWVQQGRLT